MNKNLIIELVKESFIGKEADEDGFTQIEYAGKLQDFITFAEKIIDHYETEKAEDLKYNSRRYL